MRMGISLWSCRSVGLMLCVASWLIWWSVVIVCCLVWMCSVHSSLASLSSVSSSIHSNVRSLCVELCDFWTALVICTKPIDLLISSLMYHIPYATSLLPTPLRLVYASRVKLWESYDVFSLSCCATSYGTYLMRQYYSLDVRLLSEALPASFHSAMCLPATDTCPHLCEISAQDCEKNDLYYWRNTAGNLCSEGSLLIYVIHVCQKTRLLLHF